MFHWYDVIVLAVLGGALLYNHIKRVRRNREIMVMEDSFKMYRQKEADREKEEQVRERQAEIAPLLKERDHKLYERLYGE